MGQHTAITLRRFHCPLSKQSAATLSTVLFFCLLSSVACCFTTGCATGASTRLASPQQALRATASTGVVAPAFFGMVVKSSAQQPTIATGSWRLWDAGVTWAALEPASGSFVWNTLDAEVEAAERAGVEVTLTLGMTPTWASSEPSAPSAYGAGATAMPRSLADWDAYVTAVATRYQGRITNYEVWNTPSNPRYWSGSASELGADMALLAAHAATAVRAIDVQARLVAPALDAPGMSQFLAAKGDASVNALEASLALAGEAPEAMVAELAAVRGAISGSEAQIKPLWNAQPSWTLPAGGLSKTDQAAWAARSLVLNASFGISRLAWYAWDEGDASTLRLTDATGQPTPAAGAYATMEGWLNGAAVNGCAATIQQVWSCQLIRNGQPGWIVWSIAGPVQTSSLGMGTMTDLQGHATALDGSGWVTVGSSPVLLQ